MKPLIERHVIIEIPDPSRFLCCQDSFPSGRLASAQTKWVGIDPFNDVHDRVIEQNHKYAKNGLVSSFLDLED